MAVPAISNNTPAEGQISWDAFSIQYLGVSYQIAAGWTSERWVWWRYNGGVSVIEAGPDIPVDLLDDDLVLFGNKAGIGIRIQSTSLVDGELLVDGSVFARAISAEAVQAEHLAGRVIKGEHIEFGTLSGELFSGALVMGSTITTGELDDNGAIIGARVTMGPNGFQITDATGEDILSFPLTATDLAYVKAHFELLSAEVRNNFTMRGTNNQIATGAELTLAEGVTAPSQPPVVQAAYDQLQLDTQTAVTPRSTEDRYNLGMFSLDPSQITSMAWNSKYNVWAVCQQKAAGRRIWNFKPDGSIYYDSTGQAYVYDQRTYTRSTVTFSFDPVSNGRNSELGLWSDGIWYIHGNSPAGVACLNKIPSSWIVEDEPLLSFDATSGEYMLVQNDGGGDGTFFVRRFVCVEGDALPFSTSRGTFRAQAGSGLGRRINGCVFGRQVTSAADRYVWTVDDWPRVNVCDTAGLRKNYEGGYEEWQKPGAANGFAWDGYKFASVDSNGLITYYEDWNWPEVSVKTYVGMSAYDSDSAIAKVGNNIGAYAPHAGQAAGTHETPVGELQVFDQVRRAKLRLTVPETNDSGFADDPDKWRLYYYRGPSAPVATDMKFMREIGSPTSSTTVNQIGDPVGGHNPPGGITGQPGAKNNFPGGDPGRIESSAFDIKGPLISLAGTGEGRMGPYAWTDEGKVLGGETIRLYPSITGVTISSHGLYIKKLSPGVAGIFGYMDIDNVAVSRRSIGVSIPEDLRPISTAILGYTAYGSSVDYRYFINTDGTIDFEMTAGSLPFESVNGFWFTE